MNSDKLPYGTQFTPGQVILSELLDIVHETDGSEDSNALITEIVNHFFSTQAEEQRRNLASNCRTALVDYNIIMPGGGIHMTPFGRELHGAETDEARYEMLAKHILLCLNGMSLIEAIRDIERAGERVTNESIVDAINFSDEYSIVEIHALDKWIGKSLEKLFLRENYGMNVLCVKNPSKELEISPSLDYVVEEKDILVAIAENERLNESGLM